MPGGKGLYAGADVGTGLVLPSSAAAASRTLKMPSTAVKPAVTNADVCRRIGSSLSEPGKRRVTYRSGGPPQIACPPSDRNRRNLHSAKTTGGGPCSRHGPSRTVEHQAHTKLRGGLCPGEISTRPIRKARASGSRRARGSALWRPALGRG